MRGDMPKVIVERARRGGGKLLRERTFDDDDRALTKVGVKRHAALRGANKWLNENLNPLRRYLEGQVGRPWDKVWSEICAKLKPTNTVQQHVRDHIPDFVAVQTSLRDGEVWVKVRSSLAPLKESHAELYVDPKSGLLRRNKYWKTWRSKQRAFKAVEVKKVEARMRVVSATKQLHLLADGAWWEVTLAKVATIEHVVTSSSGTHGVSREANFDDVVLRAGLSTLGRKDLYGRVGVYAASKRQLSKKEMRDFKLR